MTAATWGHGRATRRRSVAALLGLGAAIAVLAGCAEDPSKADAERDDDGAIVEVEPIGVFRLRELDCVSIPDEALEAGETMTVEAVPCDEPHDGQVAAIFDVTTEDALPWPGAQRLAEVSTARCLDAVEAALDIDLAGDHTWDLVHLHPTEDSWNDLEDHEVVCILTPAGSDEPTTAVLPGSGP